MDINYHLWFPAIEVRASRRAYDPKQLPEELLVSFKRICSEFKPFPGARVELITDSPGKIFDFILGSYGVIHNPPAALAFIGDMRELHIQEKVGYTGEALILQATAIGLGTCWVAGFFNPSEAMHRVKLALYERILAVSPLGYPLLKKSLVEKVIKDLSLIHKRKPVFDLVDGLPEERWALWVKPALESARIAPSAANRQPWRFKIGERSITISTDLGRDDFRVSKRLDCGIAMLHLELAALNSGVEGQWEFLDAPQVARFSYQ